MNQAYVDEQVIIVKFLGNIERLMIYYKHK